MLTSHFDYNLPSELIAQSPASPRDSSRLLVIDRKSDQLEHKIFRDIIDYLKPGDLLVWNNSKVFKARLFGTLVDAKNNNQLLEHKKPIEIFLIREMENKGVWKVLAKPGRHVKLGMRVVFSPDFYCDVMLKEISGEILVQFPDKSEEVIRKANQYGHIPVPPYVKDEPKNIDTYQTVYAKPEGSVAAPTAGFHFTSELIDKLKNKGIEFAEVTLHVGLGTFLPVKSDLVEEHIIHSEWVELTQENANRINRAKAEGRRVIVVGTTTVRTLEGIAEKFSIINSQFSNNLSIQQFNNDIGVVQPYSGDINIFITPGFEFKVVDAMITNFHLPKSTLLMLVSAFVGDRQRTLDIYNQAVEEKYRFYSFGDAMMIT